MSAAAGADLEAAVEKPSKQGFPIGPVNGRRDISRIVVNRMSSLECVARPLTSSRGRAHSQLFMISRAARTLAEFDDVIAFNSSASGLAT